MHEVGYLPEIKTIFFQYPNFIGFASPKNQLFVYPYIASLHKSPHTPQKRPKANSGTPLSVPE
ncbi:MAG: hypothetical protein EAZ32_05210 [Cytophagia bacterium]|nr:MAG: hypothetical protein EAZ38_07820 [Cytophagales bacterium]TAG40859.1 MAG: hypothetical protein EAZ32_05210 [Cytophagia bacterium]